MATCIYCQREQSSAATFDRVEHVLPDGFGGFRNALTLTDTVCDGCNQLFGDTIDMYLTRDTHIGLMRFFIGQKEPAEYKHLGRRQRLHASAPSHVLAPGR